MSNVSHELRTPLTSVKAYLEALNDGALADPKVASHFVDVSLNETDRMIRMIGELLELSRMDQDKVKLHTEIINYVDFINYIMDRFDQIIEKITITLKLFVKYLNKRFGLKSIPISFRRLLTISSIMPLSILQKAEQLP